MWLAGVITKAGTDQQLVATQQLGAVVLDSFRGLATLRELGAVERRGRTLADAGEQLNRATMAVLRRAFLSATMMDVVITFSIAVNATYIGLSLLGYTSVPLAPPLTLSTGLLVLLVCPMFFGPLRARAAAFHQRERAATAARTITALVGDGPAATDPSPPMRIPGAVGVSLAAVRYQYADADAETVTADVDFPPGTWTAITGATGGGKSTLLTLIAGLRVPTGGRVTWQTARGRCAPLLGECAWIGQRTVLLDATVRDNIRLGCPDATEDRIRRAVDAAGLAGTLERLPGGLDARLGEGGSGISTGEARRIAIARAFLRGAGLWLLDEPTAHLDADSEQTVVAALRRATDGCTVIVATHSPALVAAADTLLVLDDGVLQDTDLASAA
jgi:ATP-binding cassette subfamily C protein CydD